MMRIQKLFSRVYRLLHNKHFAGEGDLVFPIRMTHFIMRDGALIRLGGKLVLGANSFGYNGRSNIVRLDEQAVMNVVGKFEFMYGADVIVFRGGLLVLKQNSFINSDCKIRCHKHISIGENCAISHDVTIMDSDAHYLEGDNHTDEVIVEDLVWIGTRVTILSGTKIGRGCVVAAGAVLKGVYPAGSLIAGVPAKVIRSNINWSK